MLCTFKMYRDQSFTSLLADLCQDVNRVYSFSRCLYGTFYSMKCSIKIPDKCKTFVTVLTEISQQRSKLIGPYTSCICKVDFNCIEFCFKSLAKYFFICYHEHLDLLFSDASKIQFCIWKKKFITTNIWANLTLKMVTTIRVNLMYFKYF